MLRWRARNLAINNLTCKSVATYMYTSPPRMETKCGIQILYDKCYLYVCTKPGYSVSEIALVCVLSCSSVKYLPVYRFVLCEGFHVHSVLACTGARWLIHTLRHVTNCLRPFVSPPPPFSLSLSLSLSFSLLNFIACKL